jgi:ADP-L-glycero-D-manno-heptose 6-epimerase
MIIVTGGAGFIGSNLVHELNAHGYSDILVVDNLSNEATAAQQKIGSHPEQKFLNLHGARFADYMDKHEFRHALAAGDFADVPIRAILHQGACSNTLEDDGQYMMDNNFTYSKELLHFALSRSIPFVYASTAAVYGLSTNFAPVAANERPLNIYGWSKQVFDNYVRRLLESGSSAPKSTVVGLRYFNVFGPREQHKGRMASVIYHFARQLRETGVIRMFEGSGGYGPGEQRRDFVYVRDLCRMNLFFAGLTNDADTADKSVTTALPSQVVFPTGDAVALPPHVTTQVYSGVVNAGTGHAHTFKQVAEALMQVLGPELAGPGRIEYIPFPADLAGRYQHFTEADIAGLRELGYQAPFTELVAAVRETFRAAGADNSSVTPR